VPHPDEMPATTLRVDTTPVINNRQLDEGATPRSLAERPRATSPSYADGPCSPPSPPSRSRPWRAGWSTLGRLPRCGKWQPRVSLPDSSPVR
jgi:hypothetical protein